MRSTAAVGGGSTSVRSSAAVGGGSTSVRSSAAVGGGSTSVRSSAAVGGGSTSVRLTAAVGGGSTSVRSSQYLTTGTLFHYWADKTERDHQQDGVFSSVGFLMKKLLPEAAESSVHQ